GGSALAKAVAQIERAQRCAALLQVGSRRAASNLRRLRVKDMLSLRSDASVSRRPAGDLDIAGPAMAPELPGSRRMSINRGENLMRRASTCLAVLGLVALSALGIASAASAEITATISK